MERTAPKPQIKFNLSGFSFRLPPHSVFLYLLARDLGLKSLIKFKWWAGWQRRKKYRWQSLIFKNKSDASSLSLSLLTPSEWDVKKEKIDQWWEIIYYLLIDMLPFMIMWRINSWLLRMVKIQTGSEWGLIPSWTNSRVFLPCPSIPSFSLLSHAPTNQVPSRIWKKWYLACTVSCQLSPAAQSSLFVFQCMLLQWVALFIPINQLGVEMEGTSHFLSSHSQDMFTFE